MLFLARHLVHSCEIPPSDHEIHCRCPNLRLCLGIILGISLGMKSSFDTRPKSRPRPQPHDMVISSFPRSSLPSQHLCKALQTASLPQENVSQQFSRIGSAPDIYTKTDAQKRLQLLTQLVRILQSRCSVGGNEVESFKWFFVEIWRFRLDHLDGHDTKRPDIDFGTILLLFDDFGRHPVGSANHGGTLRFGLGEFGTEAKVSWVELVCISQKS